MHHLHTQWTKQRRVAPLQILPLLILLAASTALGQETGEKPTKTQTPEKFKVAGMTCQICADEATRALGKVPGVVSAEVDFSSKEASILARTEVKREQVRKALQPLGLEAFFPGDPVIEPLSEAEKAGLDFRLVSRGEAIRLEEVLARGKITVLDYFADWCGPCHLLSPKLERLLLKYEKLALRKIDISDWESEAARQATREFKLPGLPYVRVFGPRGEHLGDVWGNYIEKVEEIVRKGIGSKGIQ